MAFRQLLQKKASNTRNKEEHVAMSIFLSSAEAFKLFSAPEVLQAYINSEQANMIYLHMIFSGKFTNATGTTL